jgi:hypothetical protein
MQFRPAPPPQVRAVRPAKRSSPSDRDCPLVTARARSLWHAGGTAGENDDALTWRRRLQLDFSVRPVRGDDCLVGKPRRRRGSPGFPLGYESFEQRSAGCSPVPNRRIYRGRGSFPTDSRPALFLAVSGSLVSKP